MAGKTFHALIQGIEQPFEIEADGFSAAASTILADPNRFKLMTATLEGVVGIENRKTGKAKFYMLRKGTNFNLYPLSPAAAATSFHIAAT